MERGFAGIGGACVLNQELAFSVGLCTGNTSATQSSDAYCAYNGTWCQSSDGRLALSLQG